MQQYLDQIVTLYYLLKDHAANLSDTEIHIIVVTVATLLLYLAFRARSLITILLLIFAYMFAYIIYTSGMLEFLMTLT